MKICNRCGAQNRDDSRYCHDCGAELEVKKRAFDSTKSFTERFADSNMLVKFFIVIFIVAVAFVIIGLTSYVFYGDSLSNHTESYETAHLSEFQSLDSDGDGGLSFDEASVLAPDISDDDLRFIFNDRDRNGNGLLKGGEFDSFLSGIEWHYKLEENKKNTDVKEDTQQASSSSGSIHSLELGKCPECGSDESYIYEYYDEYGHPYYQCTVCDYWTYDEGDFY